MKSVLDSLRSIFPEAFLIFALVFTINNYIGNVEQTVDADGLGYYDYLPALFIHRDFVRKDVPFDENAPEYRRLVQQDWKIHATYKDYRIDKYACGTAVLQLPFFLVTYFTTERTGDMNDGYQHAFQRAVFHATLFYLFLGLVFFRKFFLLYDLPRHIIFIVQVFVVLATPVTHYANYDAGFSHVYSFFALSAFLYFIRKWLMQARDKDFLLAAVLFGLVIILRQINLLILFALPFLAGSRQMFTGRLTALFRKPLLLLKGFLIAAAIFGIQAAAWYLQGGAPVMFSYQGESFDFTDPEIINILFSYKKGLFLYTPVLVFSIAGVIRMVVRKQFYAASTLAGFFLFITYIFSCWWTWEYGCSYGSRVYIDYYALLFLPFGLLLNGVPVLFKILFLIVGLWTIPLNVIQTFQYKEFILHWMEMDKEKYRKVFLKTHERYNGLVWKETCAEDDYRLIYDTTVNRLSVPARSVRMIRMSSTSVEGFEDANLIRLSVENVFKEEENARIVVSVIDTVNGRSYYWHSRYLRHFPEGEPGVMQEGYYCYKMMPSNDAAEKRILIEVISGDEDLELSELNIRVMCPAEQGD